MRVIMIYLGNNYIIDIKEVNEVNGWWDIERIFEYNWEGKEEYLSDIEVEILCIDGNFLYELNREIREIIKR